MDNELKKFYETHHSRRSVREFDTREIEAEKLDRILNALRTAQSAANYQPWSFIVVKREDEGRGKLDKLFNKESFKEAPIAVVACAEPTKAWTREADGVNFSWIDVTIALTEMIEAATFEGVGSCWIAALDPKEVALILGVPEDVEVVAVVVLGYAHKDFEKVTKSRKSKDEIIRYGRWER
jgi:nitroreductase